MEPTSLCFVLDENGNVLLGRKKRGFGAGKYNGFGGKIKVGESFRECAIRELCEECSLLGKTIDLEPVGYLDFQFPHAPELTHDGMIYLLRAYRGVPLESEEMEPQWVAIADIPYEHMWSGDKEWLPLILEGKKIEGFIAFAEDNESVESLQLQIVDEIREVKVE